ncbi:hypothetical protein [Streptomyces sp. NPDC052107]|uniref:hypothetical protein n=1 Tax=Streptomyces sp. NPDC052107 TaxID=3155632 RepID=UPI00341D510F
MPERRLLRKLWTAALADFLPLMIMLSLLDAWDDGLSWSAVAHVTLQPAIWAFVCFLFALYVCGALRRRARGTGIPVTVGALDPTQEYDFCAEQAARLRPGLSASERAWDVLSGEELHFRWRPFRGRRSVTGTVTFDDSSGEARLRLHADDSLMTGPGLRRASAFVALCQIVRLVSR